MKVLCTLFVIVALHSEKVLSQIPNSDFESWVFTGWYEDPESWVTNNTEILALMVIKDTDAYSGQFAAKFFTSNNLIPTARAGFPISNHPAHLNAYVKSNIAADDSATMIVALYYNSVLMDIGIHYISTSYSNYTPISIPVSVTSTSVDSALIEIYGGLKYGTELKVDHLEFDYVFTGIEKTENSFPAILNNPFCNTLDFTLSAFDYRVAVFDIRGLMIFESQFEEQKNSHFTINTAKWNPGLYLCVVRNEYGYKSVRIVKQH